MKTQNQILAFSAKRTFIWTVLILVLITVSGMVGYTLASQRKANETQQPESIDAYTAFVLEIYDVVKKEYWQQVTDQQLALLFRDSAQEMIGGIGLQSEDRNGVQQLITEALAKIKPEQKEMFVTQLVDTALKNLEPVGRSSLYSTEDTQKLANTVNNIDTQVNLLDILEVSQASSPAEIESSFTQKKQELDQAELEEEDKLEQQALLDRAYQTLMDEQAKQQYTTSGIEPTFSFNLVSPDVVYLHLKQFSPTTPQDMQRVFQKINESAKPTSLILDLRSNTGGAIDTLPFLLSPFIGTQLHAYDFFKQGTITQFISSNERMVELDQFAQIVVLVDENTQSSAELMASVLKKYNTALVVGKTTKGWGTVERVFPIEKQLNENVQYSVFLVHSLTVREDGQPIEGNGVVPDVELSDSDWENKILSRFRNQELIDAVKQLTSSN